jgi:hypothetical protein
MHFGIPTLNPIQARRRCVIASVCFRSLDPIDDETGLGAGLGAVWDSASCRRRKCWRYKRTFAAREAVLEAVFGANVPKCGQLRQKPKKTCGNPENAVDKENPRAEG